MNTQESSLVFNFMSLGFKVRDFLFPRMSILKEVGIEKGFHVLDYGCGPGSYIIPATELVGNFGKIIALDTHPLAIRKTQDIIEKNQIKNVITILSNCKTGLPDESLDVVLLYDVFHIFKNPNRILRELNRVLKSNGILSFSDHHMKENEIVSRMTEDKLFELSGKNRKTFQFSKRIIQ
jgi:ubiquinone/menaquinone biosynthesis C-methylase UbiE